MTIAIINYNAGNVFSVGMALTRLKVPYIITDDPEMLRACSHVIFPGVGDARTAMAYLRARGLDAVIRSLKQPVLGICLGFQLMCRSSEEGATECLGLFPTNARRFTSITDCAQLKVPHVGWNTITGLSHPIFADVPEASYVYFVHSYCVEHSNHTIARCSYGVEFSAAAALGNFVGVQFHPEKSGEVGEQIIRNFVEWKV